MKMVSIAAATAAALLMGATVASAQTTTVPKSKAEPGAPTQGPNDQIFKEGTGSRPIGPPSDSVTPAPAPNPTGVSKEKRKGDQDDPRSGGMTKPQ